MRFDARSVDIPVAGTRVQVLNVADRVLWIQFSARTGNTGAVYVGDSSVAAARGFELSPNEAMPALDFRTEREGSVAMNVFWVDTATNGNDVDWAAIFER